jgi:hypothetical protein
MSYYDYMSESRRSRSRDSNARRRHHQYPLPSQPPIMIIPPSTRPPQQHYEPSGRSHESPRHSQILPTQQYTYIPPTSSFSGGSRSSTPSPSGRFNQPHIGSHGHLDNTPASYVAVDPFRPTISQPVQAPPPSIVNHFPQSHYDYHQYAPGFTPAPYSNVLIANPPTRGIFSLIFRFLFDTLPRQLYLHFLLRLPAFYFSRVARIFEEAEMSMPEIKKMALTHSGQPYDALSLQPVDSKLKNTWETFIDSLLREWKTLNIVSVLLLSYALYLLHSVITNSHETDLHPAPSSPSYKSRARRPIQ